VPMNLFAAWDIDRSSANCIPRICNLTICKLIVTKELDKDVQSVFIAVKMQGQKRVFRSNEIFLENNGVVNTDLELMFSLQYPHYVKRDENRLQLMLQRKKRYKNRAMLGYKTLAVGRVDMAQIIQCPICHISNLDLFAAGKDQNVTVAAHIIVSCMTSLPIDADIDSERNGKHDRSPDVENYSEDDEEMMYSSDPDLGSDNPQEFVDEETRVQKQKDRRKIRMSSSSRQQNFIKTKVAALIRKFKQVADEGLEPDLVPDADRNPTDPVDYDFLYDEIEDFNLSDSCPEIEDNISIVSTPKPKLRSELFLGRFSIDLSSSSQTEISSLREHGGKASNPSSVHSSPKSDHVKTPHEHVKPPQDHTKTAHEKSWQRSSSLKTRPDKFEHLVSFSLTPYSDVCLRTQTSHNKQHVEATQVSSGPQLKSKLRPTFYSCNPLRSRILIPIFTLVTYFDPLTFLDDDDDRLPDTLILADGNDRHAQAISSVMTSSVSAQPIVTRKPHDIQTVFAKFVAKLQKFLNSNSASPDPVKVAVIGREIYLSLVLRYFVEQLSGKSPEWRSFFVFYVVPIGSHRLSRHMASLDNHYSALFADASWKEHADKLDTSHSADNTADYDVITSRIKEYLNEATNLLQLPIAEAMLTFRQTGDDNSSQKFIPFISEIRVGENEISSSTDSDKEDCGVVTINPAVATCQAPVNATTPPASPSVPGPVVTTTLALNPGPSVSLEVKLGLQVDYWKEKDTSKYSLKTNFRSFHVSCLPLHGERGTQSGLVLDVVTKGKKMISELPGKKGKEKESESKSQAVGNINRLICTSKHQNSLLRVQVDGTEWRDIKFFQLSSHWSSHVNTFPVAVFSSNLF
uniref:Phosphofurin acidic cluster sorting protein 2 n=1 Tax=Ciona savignyi TaxID=51511 RepID=H2YM35_CIOSA